MGWTDGAAWASTPLVASNIGGNTSSQSNKSNIGFVLFPGKNHLHLTCPRICDLARLSLAKVISKENDF